MKFLAILTLFCASLGFAQVASTPELKQLDFRLLNLEYEHSVEKCFVYLEFCKLKNTEKCQENHEVCVVSETRKYKNLLKLHGFE